MGKKAMINKIIETVLDYAYADIPMKNPDSAPDIDILIRDKEKLIQEIEKLI